MSCQKGRWHQIDQDEFTCSAKQARKRWPAEAIFGDVTKTPSLQGKIPFAFLPYMEAAYAVSFLTLLLGKFKVEPTGWQHSLQYLQGLRSKFKSATL
jgi:hypothetical protein